jgi:hypothetical protein
MPEINIRDTEAVNTKTKFVETGDRKIAYRSIGKGLPIIMVNQFRGTLALLEGLAVVPLQYDFGLILQICRSQ